MNSRTTLPLLAAVSVFSLGRADASPVVSDSFNYSTGALAGQNGGSGWAGAYTVSGAGSTVSTPGLLYAGISAQGNKADWSDGNLGVFRVATSSPETVGTSLYIRFLAQTNGATGYAGISLFQGTGSETMFLGHPNNQANWGIDPKGGTVATGSVAATSLALLIYRIDFLAAGANISLYVNPAPGSEPAVADVTAAKTNAALTWDTIRIQSGGGASGAVDEFAIATTYAEVAPVPEPTSALLLLVGTVGLGSLRRRR